MKTRSTIFAVTLAGALGCGAQTSSPPPAPPVRAAAPPAASSSSPVAPPAPIADGALRYLEDVTGERALAFARAHDAVSEKTLTSLPGFHALEERLLAIYSSKDRIPGPSVHDGKIRNFWTDADHPRGLWRQTTPSEYKKHDPSWTTLLDVDALGKAEHQSYVYKGVACLWPEDKLCLVSLSKGGGDAVIVRELDTDKRAFVPNGFVLPEAKSSVSWKDRDTIFVATDFGPGTLTKSGYPRVVKEWKRGTPLSSAKTVFEATERDVEASCSRSFDHGHVYDLCTRAIDFDNADLFWLHNGEKTRIDKPTDTDADTWDDEIVFRPRSDWTVGSPAVTYEKGTLLAANLEAWVRGDRSLQVLFEPTPHSSLYAWSGSKTHLFLNVMEDVKNHVVELTRKKTGANAWTWTKTPLEEKVASVQLTPYDANRSDDAWLWLEDFTVPPTLELLHTATGKREAVKQNPAFFDAKGLEATQHFATSKDGTKIPYFEVGRTARSGPAPTILYGYGGFDISLDAGYSAGIGAAWLERGGVFVQANIRGGGEYGPAWHEAAMKHDRQKAYDDFTAVAEDLVNRGVTTSSKLGILGASNGGLLTSVMLTEHPELFGAVVSKVPLTDMKRYDKLLAGASWMSEYGDPDDPADWAAMAKYSPLQNVRAGVRYPPAFFTSSTKDDRVHPSHARKMVAKLESVGDAPLYYENIEGGHGGAADLKQRAYVDALVYSFFASRLGL